MNAPRFGSQRADGAPARPRRAEPFSRRARAEPAIWLALCAAVASVYGQTLGFGFVGVDDLTFVLRNPGVRDGLSAEGVLWAFTSVHSSNWIPLTWISYMLDVSLFGSDPRALHGVNVALHAFASCALFSALLRLCSVGNERAPSAGTDPFWPSAVVAALFALHPVQVESVAWIAVRKDVLSGGFAMLTLLAYASYSRTPSRGRFSVVAVCFALGLLAKPMLVTLPFALLLLDVWPLRRLPLGVEQPGGATTRRRAVDLAVEKWPLFALSFGAAVATWYAQSSGAAMRTLEAVPFAERIANALVSYARYVGMLAWPSDLAFLYPRLSPEELSFGGPALAAAGLLLGVTIAVVALRRFPFLPVGWFWFLGTLVPVIGVVQVGEQSLADRYVYLPSIGLFVAVAFAAATFFPRRVAVRAILAVAITGTILAAAAAARVQVGTWRDALSLWSRAVAIEPESATARDQLGRALFGEKRFAEALVHHQRAVELRPESARIAHNHANALVAVGRIAASIEEFRRALALEPDTAPSHFGLAGALHRAGDLAGALDHYEKFFSARADFLEIAESKRVYAIALGDYRAMLDVPLAAAVDRYRRALELRPGWRHLTTELIWALATDPRASRRDGEAAVEIAVRASRAPGAAPASMRRLDAHAAALATAGHFDEAETLLEPVLQRARTEAGSARIAAMEERLNRYRAGERHVESAGKTSRRLDPQRE